MEKYKTLQTLGEGAFGNVYKAKNMKNGEIVAIKKMKPKYQNWNQCIQLREIKSLRKLNHQNLIKLKEVLLVGQELYMVFEYLDYNLYDVYSKMKESGKKFTEKEIKSMVYQIVQGLASMHKNGFFHRDMKPENLLFYNNVVKICDFGLARQIRSRPPFTDYVSTRWYRAPQLLLRSTSYNSPVDVFALGCIMAELYTLCPLFPGNNEVDQMNKMTKILGTPDKSEWPQGYKLAQNKGYFFPDQKGANLFDIIPNASMQALDLIQSMLRYNSRKRPTAQEILKHDYFKDVNLPQQLNNSSQQKTVFNSKPDGHKLDTSKQDKKIDEFRQTKRKFKQTRKHDAMESSALFWGKKENGKQNKQVKNKDLQDLDSLIKELQEKGNKKKQSSSKLPLITNTNDKFFKKQKTMDMRSSKTQIGKNQISYGTQRDNKLNNKEDSTSRQKSPFKKPPSKSQLLPNKFSYSFNPTLNPVFHGNTRSGSIKASSYSNLNMQLIKPSLSSVKSQLRPLNMNKY